VRRYRLTIEFPIAATSGRIGTNPGQTYVFMSGTM
jgi:hypothetical protein